MAKARIPLAAKASSAVMTDRGHSTSFLLEQDLCHNLSDNMRLTCLAPEQGSFVHMTYSIAALTGIALLAAGPVLAQAEINSDTSRKLLGFGWLFTDDIFGDNADRWRTGSVALSWILGREWDGNLPTAFGELLEISVDISAISPEDIADPAPGDRDYAGILEIGLHTHFSRNSLDYSIGAGVVATGPQTGIAHLQTIFHEAIGSTPVSDSLMDNQVKNDFYPVIVAEAAREYDLSPAVRLRPFAEARIGDESLARIGVDMTIGSVGRSELLVRDKTTGHRYRAMSTGPTGFSFVAGADVAYVVDSVYLPDSGDMGLERDRYRVRGGGMWQGERASLFYGLTYLGREFSGQSHGQVVGSLNFKMRF